MGAMNDQWTEAWPESLLLNCHLLSFSVVSDFTLDDERADTDSSIVEDRARMYRVDCQTCNLLPDVRERDIARHSGQATVADFAVNKRTGEWLTCHRPGVDDPAQDTLGLLVEHCRDSFVCLLDEPRDWLATPFGHADKIDVDPEALATARMLVGFGSSPWEAVEVYRDLVDPTAAAGLVPPTVDA